jgi:hypothetical protein
MKAVSTLLVGRRAVFHNIISNATFVSNTAIDSKLLLPRITTVENLLLSRISACRQPVHRGSFSFESRSCSHLLDPLMTDPQAANNYAADRLRPRYTKNLQHKAYYDTKGKLLINSWCSLAQAE